MTAPMSFEEIALSPLVAESEGALLRSLLQATDYGVLLTTLDRQDIIANRRLGEIFDLTPGAIVRMEPDAVRQLAATRFRDPAAFEALLEQIYADPALTREDELALAGEPARYVRRYTGPVRNREGRPVGRLWTFLDITDVKRLQAEVEAQLEARTLDFRATSQVLRLMNDLCRVALQASATPELLTSIAEHVRPVVGRNGLALLLLDREPSLLQGILCPASGPARLLRLPAAADPDLAACFEDAAPEGGRGFTLRPHAEGEVAREMGCASLAVAPLRVGDRVGGVLALGATEDDSFTDPRRAAHLSAVADQIALTIGSHRLRAELREAMDALQATQRRMVDMARLRTAATMAASVAHEVRNILTPMQVELAAETNLEPEAIRAQLNRFFALAHQLLAYGRPDVMELRPTSLAGTLQRVLPLVAGTAELHQIELDVRLPESLPLIQSDGRQLEHLFVNLCMNGIQSMAERGGTLSFEGERLDGVVELRVADTGCGIAAEDVDRVFEPFFTRRANGLGLGLFSCKRIVEDHGGEISVRSREGEGTCFTIRLPAAGEA